MTLSISIFFSILASLIPLGTSLPFEPTSDMAIPKVFAKRIDVDQTDQLKFIYYSDETKKLLQNIKDLELTSFRCGDGIIRTIQGAYVLESEKTPLGEKRRVQNQDFIGFMRSKEPKLPRNKRILSSKVCELANGTILVFYTIGEYDVKESDSKTPRLVVLNSYNNKAFVQIISRGLFANTQIFEMKKSSAHTRCDKPFLVTRSGMLYIMCEEKKYLESEYSVYKFDLKTGKHNVLETCTNEYSKDLITSCKNHQ